MATLKDVAVKAGVSIATVSCALNNSDKVTKKTKEKVLQAAKELNYTPNKAARNLKKRKTETIGLFLSDFGGPFYNELIQGVQDVAMKFNYNMIVCSTYGGRKSTAYTFMNEKAVDAAIVLATNLTNEMILDVSRDGFPMVLLDRELDGPEIYNICIDNKKGAFEATKHLIDNGCNKIACMLGPEDSYDSQKRYEGYQIAMENGGKELNSDLIIRSDFTENGGYQAMMTLLGKNEFDGIVCLNDEMAIGTIKAAKEKGLSIPNDVSVIGFDDIILASYMQPSLSTVCHPNYEWGVQAANCIFGVLEGKSEIKVKVLDTNLVIRESSTK